MQEHNRQCKRIGMSNIGIRHIESTFFGVRIDDMTIWKAQLQTQYTVYTDSGQLQQRSTGNRCNMKNSVQKTNNGFLRFRYITYPMNRITNGYIHKAMGIFSPT